MYDFHFGSKSQILKKQEEYLIFCKRLLPRWVNGIPDSECIALYRLLKTIDVKKPILLETGCGASTLAFALYAILNNGHLFSWDMNASKGNFLKHIIADAIGMPLGVDINKIWTFIGFSSIDQNLGISIIKELSLKAHFGFFDSWHTLEHLLSEINMFEKVCAQKFIIALDDAYYTCKTQNISYINMMRQKLNLSKIPEKKTNQCKPFYLEIDYYLRKKYSKVQKIKDHYKALYKNDIFFNYYKSDRNSMNKIGMEKKKLLKHRFDAWIVK